MKLNALLLLLAGALIAASPALAQGGTPSAYVVSQCGQQTLTVGQPQPTFQDATGNHCGSDPVPDGTTSAATGAAAGVLTGTPISMAGYPVVDVTITSLTGGATLTPQVMDANGANLQTVQCWPLDQNALAPRVSFNAAGGPWECPGEAQFQLTQVGSGSATVSLTRKRAITAGGNSIQICFGTSCTSVGLPGDGTSNTTNTAYTFSLGALFNGTTWDRSYYCNKSAVVAVTAGNTTQIIALSGTTVIRICGFVVDQATTGTWSITSGTGTNCASSTTALTGTINDIAGTPVVAYGNPEIARAASGFAVCFVATTGNLNGVITYAQY